MHAQEKALTRCVELILAIAGGEAEAEGLRVGPAPASLAVVPLRPGRVTQVLGLEPSGPELEDLLTPIGFEPVGPASAGEGTDEEAAAPRFRVPGWRGDVHREIDLVEEVARRYGYDRFPEEDRRFRPSVVPEAASARRADRVRRTLVAQGLHEARSLSFMPEEHRGNRAVVPVPNPLSAEESFLRAGLVPVLLRRLEHNFARGRRDVRLFEIGTVFDLAAAAGGANGADRFVEEIRVALLVTGARAPAHWAGPTEDVDLWDLKASAEEVADRLCGGRLEPLRDRDDADAARLAGAWLDAEAFRIVVDGRTVGVGGRVRQASIDAPPWAGPVFALEFPLEAVALDRIATYEELSPFPAVRRDLSVTVPPGIAAGEVEASLRENASELLEEIRLFDVYEGEAVDEGRRALGWAFRFRARDRTLTDEEVESEMAALSTVLEERFDARIRSS